MHPLIGPKAGRLNRLLKIKCCRVNPVPNLTGTGVGRRLAKPLRTWNGPLRPMWAVNLCSTQGRLSPFSLALAYRGLTPARRA
jgi:hypothetical protein